MPKKNTNSKLQITENAAGASATTGLLFALDPSDSDYIEFELEDLRKARKNDTVDRVLQALKDFSFQLEDIEPIPPIDKEVSEEEIEEVRQKIHQIDRIINTEESTKAAWDDEITYGSGIFNFNSATEDVTGWKSPTVFKLLPAYSFSEAPSDYIGDTTRYKQSQFLEGILYDKNDDKYIYYQKQGTINTEIKNEEVLHIKSKIADFPDGKSRLINIIHLIKQMGDIDVARMQCIRRAGAPIILFKINPPETQMDLNYGYKDSSGKNLWATYKERHEYIQKVAINQSRSNVFIVPDWCEVIPIDVSNVLETVREEYNDKVLRVVQYFISRDFTENSGNAISQSAKPGLDLIKLQAEGRRKEIGQHFVQFWEKILAENGKEGWTVSLNWKDLNPRDLLNDARASELLRKAGAFTLNDIREAVGYSELADEERVELEQLGSIPEMEPEETEMEEEPELQHKIELNKKYDLEKEGDLTEEELSELIKDSPLNILRAKGKLEAFMDRIK